jgi:carboxymethylenebutenolidase
MSLSDNSSAQGEDTTIFAKDGTRAAVYLATPGDTARAQVVILPDARGLHNFYKELALRFADVGTRALAFDYFARTAESDDRNEPFDYMAHTQQMTPETFGLDLDAAIATIRRDEGQGLPTLTIGFCMGGSLSFWAGARDYNLAGAVGFYAGLTRSRGAVTPVVDWAGRIACPVLGLFGGADPGIPREHIARFERELASAGIPHEVVVYPGAPHSFFDRKADEFSGESADAWTRVQGFIADRGAVRV